MPITESTQIDLSSAGATSAVWKRRAALMGRIDAANTGLPLGTLQFHLTDRSVNFYVCVGNDRIEARASCVSPDVRASLSAAAFESLLLGQTDAFSLFIREHLTLESTNSAWQFEQVQRLVFFLVSDWKISPNAIIRLERRISEIGVATEVDSIDDIDPGRFDTKYAQRSRPLLLRKGAEHWPLVGLNGMELAELCGEERIGIFAPDFNVHPYWQSLGYHPETREAFGRSYVSVRLREYLEYCDQPGAPSVERSYLTANTASPKLKDFFSTPPYLPVSSFGAPRVWIGPRGTHTPLHRDLVDNFLTQIWGRKRVRLFAPNASPLVYPAGSVANPYFERSRIDIRAPDLTMYPLFANARCIDCMIEPGQSLFIPAGWWHSVDSLDPSMSINYFATLGIPRVLVGDLIRVADGTTGNPSNFEVS